MNTLQHARNLTPRTLKTSPSNRKTSFSIEQRPPSQKLRPLELYRYKGGFGALSSSPKHGDPAWNKDDECFIYSKHSGAYLPLADYQREKLETSRHKEERYSAPAPYVPPKPFGYKFRRQRSR